MNTHNSRSVKLYDFAAECHHETDRAFLLCHDGVNKVWIPKSQCESHGDGTYTIPEWLAREKELI
jgi:hypothetical protein